MKQDFMQAGQQESSIKRLSSPELAAMAAWRATRAVTRGAGLCASLAPLVRPARLQAPLRSFNRFVHQKGALNQVRAGWLLPQSPLVAVALVGFGGYLGADEKRCDLLVEY
eukprot:6209974-Pleurochrysis_carterae.AAC.5